MMVTSFVVADWETLTLRQMMLCARNYQRLIVISS